MYKRMKQGMRINKNLQPTEEKQATDKFELKQCQHGFYFESLTENKNSHLVGKKLVIATTNKGKQIIYFHSISSGTNTAIGKVVKYNVHTKELGEIALDLELRYDPRDTRDTQVHFPSAKSEWFKASA